MNDLHDSLLLEMLPTELIIQIFGHLSYKDLKLRVPLVCKLFLGLTSKVLATSHSTIDEILFRDAPRSSHPKPKFPCTLHPALAMLEYIFGSEISTVRFDKHALAEISLRDENASCPAASRAVLHLQTQKGPEPPLEFEGTGKNGTVTVLDVMNGAYKATQNDVERGARNLVNCGWDGIDRGEIEDGVLHLYDVYHQDIPTRPASWT